MGIIARLLTYLAHNVKVDRETIMRLVDECDMDKDGYISVAELYTMIHEWVRLCRSSR